MKIVFNEIDDKLFCIYINLDQLLLKVCRNSIICFVYVYQRFDVVWFIFLNFELIGLGLCFDCDIGLCFYVIYY